MTDAAEACLDDQTLVELTLGVLTGRSRADALAHTLDCAACRERMHSLIDTSDRLLLAAPEAEPPPGFESVVLNRLGMTGHPKRRPRLRVAAVVGLAALVLVLAGVVGAGITQHRVPKVDETAMITPAGSEVGQAWRYHGAPGWVFVSVPGWQSWIDQAGTPPGAYQLHARLDDGTSIELGALTPAPDTGSWGATTPIDARRIRSLTIVDAAGRTWCSGTF